VLVTSVRQTAGSRRAREQRELVQKIEQVFEAHAQRYGSPRVVRQRRVQPDRLRKLENHRRKSRFAGQSVRLASNACAPMEEAKPSVSPERLNVNDLIFQTVEDGFECSE
jgi:hypothetical protein